MPNPPTPLDRKVLFEQTLSAHGGVNSYVVPWLLEETTLADALNLELDVLGKRTRRRGVATIGGSTGTTDVYAPSGLFPWYASAYGRDVVTGIFDGVVLSFPGGGSGDQVCTGATFIRGPHMATPGYDDVNQRCVYITAVAAHDSNASLVSPITRLVTNGEFSQNTSMAPVGATWWGRRIWALGNVNDPLGPDFETLWWSDLNDGLTFQDTNSFQIEPGRGGRLTAIAPLRSLTNTLLIFKERLTCVFDVYWGTSSALIPTASDAVDFVKSSVRIITDDYGCVAPKSLVSSGGSEVGDFLFLAHDGIRSLQRASDDTVTGASLPLSKPIQDVIDRINFRHAHKAAGTVWEQKYYLAVPLDGATTNTHVIVYDLVSRRFMGLYDWTAADLTATNAHETQDFLWLQYGAMTTDTTYTAPGFQYHVFKGLTGTRDPNNLPVVYREDSRAYTFGSLDHKKRWEWLSVHAYNQDATAVVGVQVRVNNDNWQDLGNLVFRPVGGTLVVLGASRLAWNGLPNGVNMTKLSLADVSPGYCLQTRFTSTNPSDLSRPYFVKSTLAATVIDPEFDNSTT